MTINDKANVRQYPPVCFRRTFANHMQTYYRLLSFARPLGRFLTPFVLTSLVASVFGVLNFTLLIPLLSILFDKVDPVEMQQFLSQPAPALTAGPVDFFRYYFAQIFQQYGKAGALQFVCVVIVLSVLLSNVFKYLSVRQLETFKARMVASLREAVFAKTLNLHLGFFSSERKGNLISRTTTDVQEVENSIANTLSAASKEVFLLIGYVVALLSISVKLTLFAIVVIPISGLFIATLVRRMKRDAQDGQQRLSSLVSLLDETFGGMRVVKGFVAEGFMLDKFRVENEGYRRAVRSLANRRELASPFSEVMGVAVVAGILFYGGSLVLSGQSDLTAAEFIAYIAIFSQVTRPAKDISNAFSGSQRGLASGQRVLELIDTEPLVQDKPNAVTLPQFPGPDFGAQPYHSLTRPIRPCLRDVSFELAKGKTIALVGASGGGQINHRRPYTALLRPHNGRNFNRWR